MTGFGISGGSNLEPVGTLQRRGSDVYSITSRVVTAGVDTGVVNDVIYFCFASNGVTTPDPEDIERLHYYEEEKS